MRPVERSIGQLKPKWEFRRLTVESQGDVMRFCKRFLAVSLSIGALGAAAVATNALWPNHAAAEEKKVMEKHDIIDTAMGPGMQRVTTVVAAIKAADLVDTLKGSGPFTVFAPTNEAFAKLPAGTVDDLLKPENKEKLKSILTFHVHAGDAIMA